MGAKVYEWALVILFVILIIVISRRDGAASDGDDGGHGPRGGHRSGASLKSAPLNWGAAEGKPHREKYGPPPGMVRAIGPEELGYRGWADAPGDYEGNSVSALSGMIERSA